MIISHSSLDSLRVGFSGGFEKAYTETPTWWNKVATQVTSKHGIERYGWIAQSLAMRKWVGPRIARNLSEHKYELENDDWETTIEVDRNQIEDDNLEMYHSLFIPQMAVAAKKMPDVMVADLIVANPIAFDGKALFANDHPNYNATGSGATTYDNLHALALDATNFNTVWSTMASIIGEDGRPLGVDGALLMVPPQLRKAGLEVVDAVTTGGGDSNVMRGWANLLVVPEFAANPDAWYVADVSKPIKPVFYQLRRAAQFVSRDSPTDPKVFDRKKFTYGADARGAAGVTLPFLIAKSDPT